jgi:hypothetical protein
MEAINNWINSGCNFAEGLDLYIQNGPVNQNLLRMFKKENATTKQKLKYELKKLLVKPRSIFLKEIEPLVIVTKTTIPEEIIEAKFEEKSKKNALFFHQLPVELQPELLKANQCWKENCFLKVQLNLLLSNQESEALALQFKISDNWKSNQISWKKIDHYLEFRQLPKENNSSFDKFTPAQLLRKQQLYYQNISKMKKRLKENKIELLNPKSNHEKARVEKLVAKQNKDIILKEEQLTTLTNLIDGKN